jgi:type II secretory ATPase GspE/PulE/Tfp pilus assembly ATPase PilB-like protein
MSQSFQTDHLPRILAETGLLPPNLIEALFTGRDRTHHTMNDILTREYLRIDEQFWLEKVTEYIQNQMYSITEIHKQEKIPLYYLPAPGLNNADRIPHPEEDIYPGIEITRKGEEFHSRELAWKLPLGSERYTLLILNYDPRQVIERNYYPEQQKQVRQYWFEAAKRQGWEITARTITAYYYTTPHQWLRALSDPPRNWTRLWVRKWARELARLQGIDLYAYTSLSAFGWSNITQGVIERQGVKETYADRAYRAKKKLEQEFGREVTLVVPLYKTDPGVEEPYKRELDPLEASARLTEDEQIGLTYWENIIRTAVERGASDIHITPVPGEKGAECQITVRLREQGVLAHYTKIPERIAKYFYQCVHRGTGKEAGNTAALDDLRRSYIHPQSHKEVDLRISITSGMYRYPQIVLRILDQERLPRDVKQLRLNHRQTELFLDALNLVDGLVLVVGETGSGKSATVYCALNTIHDKNPNRAITSIEDPIEYRLPFISHQVAVDKTRDIAFPNAIRQTVRNDPDTIMVGEMRDLETVNAALSLSLSGHQMLTTLHANNCVDAISRLSNMRCDMDILARVLRFVIAQRLIGIPCQHCCIYCETHPESSRIRASEPHRILTLPDFKKIYLPSIANDIINTHLDRWQQLYPEIDRQGAWVAKGDGCPKCHNIGYSGRRVVMEMLYLKERDQNLVRERKLKEIEKIQQKRGLFRVPINTWELAWSGQTSVQAADALTNKLEAQDD